MFKIFTKTKAAANTSRAMECRNHPKNAVSPKNHRSRGNLLMITFIFTVLCISMMSCGTAKNVSVFVTPSNTNIYYSSGSKAGTGSCDVYFSRKDKKYDYRQLTLQAPTYRTQLVKVYKSDYPSRNFTMVKKVDTNVSVYVTPSSADIYDSKGKKISTGNCSLTFDEDDASNAYYELTLQLSGYRTQTVKVYKSDSPSRNFTMVKKVDTNVSVSVTPSNADIYYKNGNKAGTGNCTLTFDEDDKSDAFYELTIEAPYYYSQTVRVYKSDNSKRFTLQQRPIKTVVVIPAGAEIYVNNELVGKDKYDVSFENTDKVMLTFKLVGCEEATYTLLRSNPEQTVTYRLDADEAYENSIGGETVAQFVNQWVPITVRQGLNEDEVWLRMMSIVRENFDAIDKTDKSSRWIKTFPAITPYKASDVRTTFEIVPSYSTGVLQYKVRLSSEKRRKGSGDEGWERYDRLLKIYKDVIENLRKSISDGM